MPVSSSSPRHPACPRWRGRLRSRLHWSETRPCGSCSSSDPGRYHHWPHRQYEPGEHWTSVRSISKHFYQKLVRSRVGETKSQLSFSSENQVWRPPLCLKTDVDEEGMVKGLRQGTEAVQSSNRVAFKCAFYYNSVFRSHQQWVSFTSTVCIWRKTLSSLSSSGSRDILFAVRNIGWCWWLDSKSDIFYFVFTVCIVDLLPLGSKFYISLFCIIHSVCTVAGSLQLVGFKVWYFLQFSPTQQHTGGGERSN